MKLYDVEFIQTDGGYNKIILEASNIFSIMEYLKADKRILEVVSISLRK